MPKYLKTYDGNGNPVYTEVLLGDEVETPGGVAHAQDALLHSSGQEIAYAENASGTALVLGTSSAAVDGCSIVLPPNPRPVWIEYFGLIDVVTAPATGGTGTATLAVVATSSGAAVSAALTSAFGPNGASGYMTIFGRFRIPPNTATDTYYVTVNRGGQTWAGNLMNGTIAPAFKTYIAAFQT